MPLKIVLLCLLVALGATNPSKSKFVSYASERYIIPLLRDAGAIDTKRDNLFSLIAVSAVADAVLSEVTDHTDLLLFSLYTIDLSYLRIYGLPLSDLKVLGIANNFVILEKPSADNLNKLTERTKSGNDKSQIRPSQINPRLDSYSAPSITEPSLAPREFRPPKQPGDRQNILAEYASSIRARIRSRISFDPARAPDNPEVIFSVEQESTGRVIKVIKKQTSGNAGWDAAVERAIWGSSPLPKASDGTIENRLTLAFRPLSRQHTETSNRKTKNEFRTAKLKADCSPPEYPRRSLRNNEQGITQLRLLIGVDGKVKESVIAESSGYDRLDRAAVSALSRCEFEPEVKDGIPIESWGKIRYVWKLE